MAKHLNVDLTFGADISKAKAQIAELQKSLQNIATLPGKSTSLFDDADIKAASKAALELQGHLQNAVNVDTGKLDLSRLSLSLKSANKDLGTYYNQLTKIGPQGQETFLKIAQSIAAADAPVTRVNKKLAEMGTTLKNTARWQISSSILHGFMGTIQSAYGYAQDLNKSLNDIRIVTGKNADTMDEFAVRANKAAKALSTTTTAYTEAALIFYQQGLDDDAVTERANATIKMANVTGENASDVSSYMTAIWNNFDDGSKSLEYYGDVMAELGAKTAASSEEIAAGLEKFASIGETVGLSYETATAAVATVVDKTRASADTVGTAFKTIFARLQGLQLGETLEDGVDLNKYSTALQAVGVSVLDLNGNLREADEIIYDLGAKWETLGNAEKTALAQTVAGTRQYATLMSFMNNFDDFKENVAAAEGSEGELQRQANIYAESWEAAQDRVRAASENIYDSIIDDDFFITILNGVEKILDTVGSVIDGFGGLGSILTTVGSVFMTYYAQKMPKALEGLRANIMVLTGQSGKLMAEVQDKTKAHLMASTSGPGVSDSYKVEAEGISQVIDMRQRLMKNSKNMTNDEVAQYEARIKNVQAIYDEVKALAKRKEELDKQASKSGSDFAKDAASKINKTFKSQGEAEDRVGRAKTKMDAALNSSELGAGEEAEAWSQEMAKAGIEADKFEAKIDEIKQSLMDLKNSDVGDEVFNTEELQNFDASALGGDLAADGSLKAEDQKKLEKAIEAVTAAYKKQVTQRKQLDSLSSGIKSQAKEWTKNAKDIDKSKEAVKELRTNMSNYLKVIKDLAKANGVELQKQDCEELERVLQSSEASAENLAKAFDKFSGGTAVQKMDAQVGNLDDKLEQLEGTMETVGMDTSGMQQMRNDAEEAAEAAVNLATAQENARGQAEAHMNSEFKASVAISQAGAAAMSAYSMIQSLSTAITTFGDEDATALEKVGAAMAVLMAAGQGWNAVMQLSTSLYKSEKVAKLASAAITKIFTGVKTTETGVVIANTAAWYANPIMWIAVIIMAVIAAIVALIAIISAQNKALEEANKKMFENSQKIQEATDNTQALAEEVDNLTDSYKELTEAGENTTEVLAKMDEKIPELITSYKELAKTLAGDTGAEIERLASELESLYNLAKLTGDFSDFFDKKEEIDMTVARAEYFNAKTGGAAGGKLAADAMVDKAGGSVSGKTMTLHVEGADSIFDSDKEESVARDILAENMGGYYTKKSDAWLFDDTAAELSVDYTDPAKFADYYEKLQVAQSEMLSTMSETQLANSGIYSQVTDALASGAEYYEKIKPLADAQIEAGGKLAEAALLQSNADYTSIDSMEEYMQYRKQYIKLAQDTFGLTKEQAEAYVDQNEKLGALNTQYQLGTTILDKFYNAEMSDLSSKNQKEFMKSIETMTEGLDEEDLQIALGVAMNTESVEQFETELRHAIAKSTTAGYEVMSSTLSEMMANSQENGSFSQSDMAALGENEEFTGFLSDNGIESMNEFGALNYDEQYAMVAEFHAKVQALRHDSVQYQKELYYEDLRNQQEAYDAMLEIENAKTEDEIARRDEMLKLKEEYAEKEKELSKEGLTDEQREDIENELRDMELDFKDEFGFAIDMDTTDARNRMDQLLDQIKELDEQQIKIAIEWDGIEEIEGAFENVGDFASMMQKDAKKVGNSYQLTAAQARKWMEVYPDLFKQAQVNSNGIIELDEAVVQGYLDGQNAEVDATVDAKIAELQAERQAMQAKLEMAEADLQACYDNLHGKEQLEGVSAEYLAEQRKNLTQYYMDLGMDEVNADAAALRTMGLNEEEYTNLVAEASEKNANNQIDASEAGGKAQASVLSKLAEKWKSFTSILKRVGAAVKAALTGEDVAEAWGSVSADLDSGVAEFEGQDLSGYSFEELDEQQITAARETVNSELAATLEANKANIQKALDSIDSQIIYLEALKNQDISDYGSTDVDDVNDGKGSGKDSGGNDKEKDIEELEKVLDRYHEINREIEYQNQLLDQLGKMSEMAHGQDKLDIMAKEEAALKALLKADEDLLLAQTAMLASDLSAVQDAFTGVQVDPVSQEINYTQLKQQAADRLNAAKKTYNSSAQEDADKKALEEAEKRYEEEVGLLDQYEETLTEWRDQTAKVIEDTNNLLNKQLEQVEYRVEMKVEIEDKKLEYLDYLLQNIENSAFSAAEAIAEMGKQTQAYMNKSKAYEQGVKDIFSNHGLTEDDFNKFKAGDEATIDKIGKMKFTDAEQQTLKDYTSSLIETNQALLDTRQAVHDKLLSAFEEMSAELDKNIEKLDALATMTESYRTIVDLVGKSNFAGGNETIAEINKATVAQAKNIAQAKKAKRDALAEDIKYAEEQYALQKDNISEEERKMWEDSIAEMKTQLQTAEQEAMDSITSWMEKINQEFQDSITATLDKFSDTVAGRFSSIAELSDAFGRAQTKNDRYLEDYQKIYEFSKLTRDIEKSMDDTDNVRAKKELRKLLEEINEIEESGAEVSTYQVENLRKQFELKQAELALEEVKDAKSQVRMTRDNDGNWGYVYTANDQDVAAAEQSYEDKLYELQEHNAEYINQLQESIITMQQEMADKLAEIAADEALSIEERQAKMDEVRRFYQEQMGYYNSELSLALDNNKTLYEDDWMAYSERTGYKISADEDYVDSFEETDYAILTGFQNMEQSQLAFNQASQTMLDESNAAFVSWKDQMKDALDEADLNFDNLKEDIKEDLGEIVEESNATAEAIEQDAIKMVQGYADVVDAVVEWELQYSESVANMTLESDKIIGKFTEVLNLWNQVKEAAEQGVPEPPSGGGGDSGGGGGDSGGGGGTGGGSGGGDDGMPPDNSSKAEGVAAAIWMDGGAKSGWYNGSDRRSRLAEKGVTAAQAYINAHGPNGDIYRTWASKRGQLRNFYYGSFDTGGYTGEWGSEGRFAMLHEKELVLNPADTENLLSAVNLIREISSIIDLNAMSASLGLTSLLGIGKIGTSRESLEQTVTIHAEFPGVTDRNEIEEAFSNLINTASQYANRKS